MTTRRDSKGRFTRRHGRRTSRQMRAAYATTRRMPAHKKASGLLGGTSPKRLMTIIGIGAAAIFLTQKMTSPGGMMTPASVKA